MSDGFTFSSSQREWGDITVEIPFEWVVEDETGVSSGPIRRNVIIGGKYDGAHVYPMASEVGITWNPEAFGGSSSSAAGPHP